VAVLAQEHIGKYVHDEDSLQNLRTTWIQECGIFPTPAERDLISWLLVVVGIIGLRCNSFWNQQRCGPLNGKLGAQDFGML
jgi:hypothetical protein